MGVDGWMTVQQAADEVGRSHVTIRKWIASGEIRTSRPMLMMWVWMPDVFAYEGKVRLGRPPRVSS